MSWKDWPSWLKGGIVGLAIGIIILLLSSYSTRNFSQSIFLLVVLIISGIIIGFFHNRIKLRSYKAIYLFYIVSFILIMLLFIFAPGEDWETFNYQTFLFLAFPIVSLIFSGIFWIFDKKQFKSNFMVYLSFYLSTFAILVIMSSYYFPIMATIEDDFKGEAMLLAGLMIILSYFVWGLSLIFLIIGWMIEKRKSKKQLIQTK
jgi:predicted neutral ceramidase superfamily lipid hydrolase